MSNPQSSQKSMRQLDATKQKIEHAMMNIESAEQEQDEYISKLPDHFAEILKNYMKERDFDYESTFLIPLARLIEDEGKMSLNDVIRESGLARQTVYTNLKNLVRSGFLSRKSIVTGRGRPTILYYRTQKPINSIKVENAVTITFQKLKHACRFEKGGFCKEKKCHCSPTLCPIIIKK